MPAEGLVYACVTHVPLWLDVPSWITPICLGDEQREGRLNLRDLAPDWVQHHPVIGGSAGSFALRRYVLEWRRDATHVGLCQYRKFVSRQRISRVRDSKYRVMDVVPLASLDREAYARHLDPGDADFLLSAPRSFTRLPWYRRSYLKEYARDHVVEDFLRFAAAAVELGVLGKKEVLSFLNEDVIIPGGVELGVYPAGFWLESIGKIEEVVRFCIDHHPVEREGAQARVWSFCAERLGSWLLLRHLRGRAATSFATRRFLRLNQRVWASSSVGQLNLISQDAVPTGYRATA